MTTKPHWVITRTNSPEGAWVGNFYLVYAEDQDGRDLGMVSYRGQDLWQAVAAFQKQTGRVLSQGEIDLLSDGVRIVNCHPRPPWKK